MLQYVYLAIALGTADLLIKRLRPDSPASANQGSVTLIASVLRSATAVKTKVNGQIEIFAVVNGQATISL